MKNRYLNIAWSINKKCQGDNFTYNLDSALIFNPNPDLIINI